jgi:hypothetical protein
MMKNIIVQVILILFLPATCIAQAEKTTILENLEQTNPVADQVTGTTAILRSASRLFGEKDDLTAVIMVIPSGSTVQILGSDSTYLHVKYEDTEGYIFNRNLTLNQTVPIKTNEQAIEKVAGPQQQVTETQQKNNQSVNRFSLLENKYGTSMAAKLYAGKIWKGMSAEMVNDSWGTPVKVNRSINANIVKEEWIFKNTWLFFENDRLIDWGPIRR